MRRLLAVVFFFGSALPALGLDVQVQAQGGGPAVPGAPGAGVSMTPALGSPQGLVIGLAPTLLPALQTPLSPTVSLRNPSPGTPLSPAAPVRSLSPAEGAQALPAAPAQAAVLQAPKASLALPASALHEAAPVQGALSQELGGRAPGKGTPGKGGAASEKGAESSVQAGRSLFDGSAGKKPSLLGSLRSLFGLGDKIPAYPGAPGQKLRIGGVSHTLGRRISETRDSIVYGAEFDRDFTFRLLKPGADMDQELAALGELSAAGIPHADIVARSADGRFWVQRLLQGETPAELESRNAWRKSHLTGFADLAASLILKGRSADLSPGNLVYEHWNSRWALVSGKGFSPASPGDVLSQLLAYSPVEAAELLSALRGRLGPESEAWARVQSEPSAAPALQALARLDASRPPGPRLKFAAAAKPEGLDDSLASRREMSRRLGYDAFSISPRRMLHTDDPGKLNTQVFSVETPDGEKLVGKIASAEIIRNELFLRKIVHRWFGEYFQTPWSLASLEGSESSMLMQTAEGSRAYAKPALTPPQRAALGVLMRTFGVSDVNPGNVLYSGGRVALIDFEQALGRARPVPNRIPDPGILLELPWANGEGLRIEDFLPAIRGWREHLAKPETQTELARMLAESGFKPAEIPGILELIRRNAADLSWTLQSDLDFADSLRR